MVWPAVRDVTDEADTKDEDRRRDAATERASARSSLSSDGITIVEQIRGTRPLQASLSVRRSHTERALPPITRTRRRSSPLLVVYRYRFAAIQVPADMGAIAPIVLVNASGSSRSLQIDGAVLTSGESFDRASQRM
jgi:hypothetical protein